MTPPFTHTPGTTGRHRVWLYVSDLVWIAVIFAAVGLFLTVAIATCVYQRGVVDGQTSVTTRLVAPLERSAP